MRLDVIKMNTMHRIARLVPRTLAYYCAINVIAYATTGKYGTTVVPELSAMDALKRFGDDHKI